MDHGCSKGGLFRSLRGRRVDAPTGTTDDPCHIVRCPITGDGSPGQYLMRFGRPDEERGGLPAMAESGRSPSRSVKKSRTRAGHSLAGDGIAARTSRSWAEAAVATKTSLGVAKTSSGAMKSPGTGERRPCGHVVFTRSEEDIAGGGTVHPRKER